MFSQWLPNKSVKQNNDLTKTQISIDTTLDMSVPNIKNTNEQGSSKSLKIGNLFSGIKIKSKQLSTQKLPSSQPEINQQLLQIFKMSSQVSRQNKRSRIYQKINQAELDRQYNQILIAKLHKLFDLYIKEEILKHYCLKVSWKVQKVYLDKYVMPIFELLLKTKDEISLMFQPFLKQLTTAYILHTQLDTYSRHSAQLLIIQISQVWLLIKKTQIQLKRILRTNISKFKQKYCKILEGQLVINRNALYNNLFLHIDTIKMVNLIKIFFFCFKVQGQCHQKTIENWVQDY